MAVRASTQAFWALSRERALSTEPSHLVMKQGREVNPTPCHPDSDAASVQLHLTSHTPWPSAVTLITAV